MSEHFRTSPEHLPRRQDGYALLVVVIFAFILGIAGAAFFAMASYENRNALHREDSAEAFYLADGAIERARGEFLQDMQWRGPIPDTDEGNGFYNLTVTDGMWTDGDAALRLHAEGQVKDAHRAVEAWVRVRPAAGESFIVMYDLISDHGNMCLTGNVHANHDADFGSDDVHLKCGGTYTEGFELLPPVAYTEPAVFPNSTYYYVYGDLFPERAIVYRYDWATGDTVDVTPLIGDMKAEGVFSWDNKKNRFKYDFTKKVSTGEYAWKYYFDINTGKFALDAAAGHTSVVVNFGASRGLPWYDSDVYLKQLPGDAAIQTCIINTRFIGASDADRLDWTKWTGGDVYFETLAALAPLNCISMIAHVIDFGNAQVQIGTPAHPAMCYVTGDVTKVNGQLEVNGTMIVLHNFFNTGGPALTFNPAFLDCLPPYWRNAFEFGSGAMVVLEWKEVAVES